MSLLMMLDYAGVALFAATGALAASRKELDLIGFLFFAAVTGLGGGTVRDLILGRVPVFWVLDPTYIVISVVAGIFVFLTAHRVEWRYRLLIWLDAIGLAAYSVLGAAKGLAVSGSPTIAIVTGTLTAPSAAFCAIFLPMNHPCFCGRKSISRQRLRGPVPSRPAMRRACPSMSVRSSALLSPSACAEAHCITAGCCRATGHAPDGLRKRQ